MPYDFADEHEVDPAKIAANLELSARCAPLTEGSPQWRY